MLRTQINVNFTFYIQ